jgi:hypothetical protein
MSAYGNGQFREDEVVVRRSKINGEWVETRYVKIGGKLRVLHQENEQVSIMTEILSLESDYVVCRATVTTAKGIFTGIGVATLNMDARIGDAIVSLSETRAVARACRHAGYAMDSCGAEELAFAEMEPAGPQEKLAQRCANNRTDDSTDQPAGGNGSKGQHCPIEKPHSHGAVTSAQVRALFALTKRARYSDEDIDSLLGPLNASTFQELTREDASRLIQSLQTEVAA